MAARPMCVAQQGVGFVPTAILSSCIFITVKFEIEPNQNYFAKVNKEYFMHLLADEKASEE